ncbi:predicted protein [Pyrenophora tritici-repentis Pt-1C-BFP]|uniref:Uncharacterized protein n=1 Tax=Pyrenophora tritici-repentis (strain Pt-1C-BFP) TaxID=426418 RepID=B2W1J4_PYRTR|nr:uncharacterized protein PTRG_04329 [Pyrenophora tritici-repentis Pt-1C-BFP]EDU47167.1 predicted protein [Pyrenophora tritici-repentis Pt-1C-BFP]
MAAASITAGPPCVVVVVFVVARPEPPRPIDICAGSSENTTSILRGTASAFP